MSNVVEWVNDECFVVSGMELKKETGNRLYVSSGEDDGASLFFSMDIDNGAFMISRYDPYAIAIYDGSYMALSFFLNENLMDSFVSALKKLGLKERSNSDEE